MQFVPDYSKDTSMLVMIIIYTHVHDAQCLIVDKFQNTEWILVTFQLLSMPLSKINISFNVYLKTIHINGTLSGVHAIHYQVMGNRYRIWFPVQCT